MSATEQIEQAWELHDRRNREVHTWIVRCSKNRKLLAMYRSSNAHIQIARIHRAEVDWRQRLSVEHREHAAIVTAFEPRNAAAAVAALRHHLSRAADSLVWDLRRQVGEELQHATGSDEDTP
jgi:DNA-binding GntR family transcriptional regulator